jgi:hypothetical protein
MYVLFLKALLLRTPYTILLVVTRLTYHVHKAHDLCEAHIYCQHCNGELEEDIHQSTTHTYRNAVILVPVD